MLKQEKLQMEFMTYYDSIVNLARAAFRHVPPSEREEIVAEVFAGEWRNFLRYRGKARLNASFLAYYPIQSVRANMKFTGCDSRDIMSKMKSCRKRPARTTWETCNPTEIAGSVKEDPAEYARIKIDFDDFASRLTLKERKVFYLLLRDYNASEIGRKLGVGPNAIWQRMKKIRRRLKDALEDYASA